MKMKEQQQQQERDNKNVTLLQSASQVSSPERNAIIGASQSVRRRNDNNTTPQELTKEIVEVL